MQTEYDNLPDIRFEDLTNLLDSLGINYTVGSNEKENKMENLNDTNPVDIQAATPLTPEQMAKLMEEMANKPITTDEAEPTDAERVLH